MPGPTDRELRDQWRNPEDIFNILLLIGGDIVQKAVVQLIGYSPLSLVRHRPQPNKLASKFWPFIAAIPLSPVAFSFGWVAFGFSQLLSAVGDRRLVPEPEKAAIIVNCANAFQRDNNSWMLDRLLRDHEVRNPVDEEKESLRIDIYELGPLQPPAIDRIWWLGWLTIASQVGIAIPPWVLYGDWGVMMVTLSGTLLSFATCCLPQWSKEKWAGRMLDKDNVTCLTRGNGYKHIMVFIGSNGSPDLETFATARGTPRAETPALTAILAVLWVFLLLTVSSLKENAWYLVGVGGIGMLQNVYAAGATRQVNTTGLQLTPFERQPTIIGQSRKVVDDNDADVDLDQAEKDVLPLKNWVDHFKADPSGMPPWLETMEKKDGVPVWLEPARQQNDIVKVHGALKELEKWVPGAGLAMLQVFFPTSLKYDDEHVRDKANKKFWRRAWHTKATRRYAEQDRRKLKQAAKNSHLP